MATGPDSGPLISTAISSTPACTVLSSIATRSPSDDPFSNESINQKVNAQPEAPLNSKIICNPGVRDRAVPSPENCADRGVS